MSWPMVRLGDVCAMRSGGTPRRGTEGYYGGPIPWAKISDLEVSDGVVFNTEESITSAGLAAIGNRLFPAGTVLLAMYGSVGKTALAGCSLATNQAILGITPRDPERVDPRYVLRWLDASKTSFVAAARGATQANISKTIVENTAFPLPPLAEQSRIADVLHRADTVRRKRNESVALTRHLLRSAFLETFGDPVANPKRWPLSTFGDELDLLEYGPRFYNEKYSADGVPIVRITDLDPHGHLDFSQMPRLAVSQKDRSRYSLRPGDVIFARSGATVGKTALSMPGDPEAIPGAYFVRLRFKSSVRTLYAQQVLASDGIQQIIASRSRQSAQQNFSGPGIRELPLPVPPVAVQRRIERVAESTAQLRRCYQTAELESGALFDALVHRAFAGELTPEAATR